MAALHDLTALEAAAAVRRREVSPTELVEHALDRIERLDDQLGAFVTVTADRARAEAAAADDTVLAGGDLPLLFGVPVRSPVATNGGQGRVDHAWRSEVL